MKLTFDYYHNLEQVELRLCNPDGRELFPLPGKSRNLTLRFNDLSELTFEVDSKITLSDGTVVDLEAYDYIQTKRLVYATNIGWFQISGVDEQDNGITKSKSVTAESYQSVLKNKGFYSEERVYCFYNPNDPHDDRYDATKEDSIPSVLGQWSKQLGIKQALGQGLADPDVPYDDWTVTYVNSSLTYAGSGSICRTFKENTTFGYDWIVNDVEEAFEVVILFDFMYKTIHVMIPSEVTQKANVVYTFNNFMKSVNVNENADDIVTVLNCNGDNCNIMAVNPTGTNYICDFSYYMDKVNHRWMSAALIEKLEQWKEDCDNEKNTYESYVAQIRTLYQTATEKETLLQEMSLSLADLRTAQNKRMVLGSGTPGSLCGIVTAESVQSGNKSIKSGTTYYSAAFTGEKNITAYQFSPTYDTENKKWVFSGASKTGTANAIVAENLSDSNTSGISYWYFSDVTDGSSYCKLQSSVTVNKDTATSTYYCGGFDRYIAYTYPIVDESTGDTVYTDTVQSWIDLRESHVNTLNTELCGYALQLNGYQIDKAGEVINPTSDSIYGRINTLQSQISEIANRLNIIAYFSDTPALLRELNCYWIEGDYTNENIAVLEETTPEEEIDLSNELLASGYIELGKVCQPRFSFSIESIDATKQYEFRNQMRELELGKIVAVEKEEGLWYYPALLEISISLDKSDEFNMSFANAMRLDDWGYTYADLMADASATSRKVSANWQDILAYAKEREEISSLIKDPLDTTLRAAFANMVNQEFTIDKNGILGRKKVSETSDEFEDEQVRLINNLLIFTDDNWETAKTALGKIYYTDEDGNQVTSYGLIAETIIGSLVMGERLKIKNTNSTVEIGAEGISIKQADGTVVFSAKPDGSISIKSYVTEGDMNNKLESYVTSSSLSTTLSSYTTNDELTSKLTSYVTSSSLSVTLSDYLTETGGVASSFSWEMTTSGFILKSNSNTVMKVTSSGLEVTGKLTATGGSAGGWTISTNEIYKGSAGINAGEDYVKASLVTSGSTSPVRFYCGNGNRVDGKFVVLDDGSLYATAANITGNITATSGTFNGTITSNANYDKIIIEDGVFRAIDTYDSRNLEMMLLSDYLRFSNDNGVVVFSLDANSGDASIHGTNLTISGGVTTIAYTTARGGMVTEFTSNTFQTYNYNFVQYASMFVSTQDNFCIQTANSKNFRLYGDGTSNMLQGSWFTSDSVAIKSDVNSKTNISDIDAKYEELFDILRPVIFKYLDGRSGRYHTGFIAQEVDQALRDVGLSRQDFAALCVSEEGTEQEYWGLRYEEFIALCVLEIQKLKKRIKYLEQL